MSPNETLGLRPFGAARDVDGFRELLEVLNETKEGREGESGTT